MFNYLLHYGRVQLLDGNHGEWRNGPEPLELNNVRRTGPARIPASSSGRSDGSPSLWCGSGFPALSSPPVSEYKHWWRTCRASRTRAGCRFCPLYLFAESLSLDGDGFVSAMILQDADGADAALTCFTVDLETKRRHEVERPPVSTQRHSAGQHGDKTLQTDTDSHWRKVNIEEKQITVAGNQFIRR